MADEVYRVFRICLISRLIVTVFQCASNNFIADYDSSSLLGNNNGTLFDNVASLMFQGFTNWDSAYFLEIAEQGYQYEQYMAFFPLYPLLMRLPRQMVGDRFNRKSIFVIVGWSLSCVFFTVAAVVLYKLTRLKFKDHRMSLFSSILFCMNPAAVFMNTIYSESMFACFLFIGLYCLEVSSKTYYIIIGSLAFALGSATRSNGLLSCGFVCYFLIKRLVNSVFSQFTPNVVFKHDTWKERLSLLANTTCTLVISNAIILSPFFLFQYYGYYIYCSNSPPTPPWCNKTIPLSYSYIQDHYWDVGFLRYYEVKQIPNFLLALPMFILCFGACTDYLQSDNIASIVKTLGLWQEQRSKQQKWISIERTFHSPEVFVYIVHLCFLTVFAVTSIHVQVLTRMIASSSPVIYWYSAHLIAKHSDYTKLILGYFITYFTLGIILHCNFYPWT